MDRDVVTEAITWRENIRPESPLVDYLASMDEATLIEAYMRWWSAYTQHIRNSPTVARSQGVSEPDARQAAIAANNAVIEMCSDKRGDNT